MRFEYTQIFLLLWFAAFWIYYSLTYGKVEGRHEQSMREKYHLQVKWAGFFGLAFMGWSLMVLIFFFHYDSIGWIWKINFLDNALSKNIAVVMMCIAFLLNILFTRSLGKSIEQAYEASDEPQLITTGIYAHIRHPGYLAFAAAALGSFLIIPNIITFVLLGYTCVVIYYHTSEEEKKLLAMYGDAYEKYRSEVGRYLPKIL